MGCAQSNVCAGREAKKKDEDDGDGDGDESEEDLLGSEADFSNAVDDLFGDILAMKAQFEAGTPPPERRAPPPPAVPGDPVLTAAASLFGAPPRVQMSESECSDREESFVTDSAGSGGADGYDIMMKKICCFDLTRDPRTDVIVATSLLTRDEGGALPLHLAAKFGSAEAVREMLRALAQALAADHGENFRRARDAYSRGLLRDGQNRTPFWLAAVYSRDVAVVQMLLDHQISYDSEFSSNDRSIGDIVRESGGPYNWCPLHAAAAYSTSPEVVRYLVRCDPGLALKCRTHDKCTMLHMAGRHSKSVEVVRVLLEEDGGAEQLSARDRDLFTPVHLCAGYNKTFEVLQLMLSYSLGLLQLHKLEMDGCTPLFNAARNNGSVDVMRLLLQHNDVVEQLGMKNKFQWNPVHLAAAWNPNADVLRLMLEHDAGRHQLKVANGTRDTPLFLAAKYNHENAQLRAAKKRILLEIGDF